MDLHLHKVAVVKNIMTTYEKVFISNKGQLQGHLNHEKYALLGNHHVIIFVHHVIL